MAKTIELDPKNTSSKETIRKKIRHALSSKSLNKFPNIDLFSELFDQIDDTAMAFATKFREEGGKFIPCKAGDFFPMLMKLIENQHYNSILASDDSLIKILKEHGKNVSKMMFNNMLTDMAIFRADLLIARSGSMCFSQKHTLYPSVKNLAKDVIVVARPNNIVPDLKTAQFVLTEKYGAFDLMEIITPEKQQETEEEETSNDATSPTFILFMVI